ncbi:MAG: ABC transporter ATP-binding protein [Clostridiaceae bacterium]|nr:ABC transporter ATP-binding protein [Clostridiaceae bacterium]
MSVISIKDIEKKFKVYYDKGQTFKERLLFRNRNHYEERLVLKGISFQVEKGQAIGLIGENGSGKSTLLKLMTRIMYPDKGSIEIKGRVSSLIELGAGFHPDMSGRENIYTNASIFGLTKKEVDSRIKDIIEFSELEEFIDNPVRTYSSGMYMRLAFSVAINVDADILLIDEILAVGDVNFQAKCFNKLREIKSKGTTIVIVSHSLGQIEQICDRTIWIQDGLIKAEGSPRTIHPEYMDFMGQKRQEIIDRQESKKEKRAEQKNETENNHNSVETISLKESKKAVISESKRWGNGKARISKIETFGVDDKTKKNVFKTGESIKLRVDYIVKEKIIGTVFGIAVYRSDGLHCYGVNTKIDKLNEVDIINDGTFEILLENVNLLPGEYIFDIAIECGDGIPVDYYREAHTFQIYSTTNDVGIVRIQHKWSY